VCVRACVRALTLPCVCVDDLPAARRALDAELDALRQAHGEAMARARESLKTLELEARWCTLFTLCCTLSAASPVFLKARHCPVSHPSLPYVIPGIGSCNTRHCLNSVCPVVLRYP
jgi:hypothetical protein